MKLPFVIRNRRAYEAEKEKANKQVIYHKRRADALLTACRSAAGHVWLLRRPKTPDADAALLTLRTAIAHEDGLRQGTAEERGEASTYSPFRDDWPHRP